PATPVGWDTTVALDRIISAHNDWLWRQNQSSHDGEMETTLTALVVGSRFFTVAHVGDCRCYVLRGQQLIQLTQEHTRYLSLAGQRGPLTRALGLDERVLVDYRQEPVQLGDVFLLVSDGVWSCVTDGALQELLQGSLSAQVAAERICQAAVQGGSLDDASAIVLRVLDWTAHDLPLPNEGDVDLPLPPKLSPGDFLDGLRIERAVGGGGANRVYKVYDESAKRPLALKTLTGRGPLREERMAIAREHWLCAHGPSSVARAVPPLHAASVFYCLFEWIEGQSLAELGARSSPIGVAEWMRIAAEALRAVGALHRRGIIHRDIKPQNLVLEPNGQVRVLDLGVAITRRRDDRAGELRAGTPAYINPEQWNGEAANEASDVFALGVTLYHLLTKALPYGEIQPFQSARYERDPVPATELRPDVPVWVDHWLARAYDRRPASRYETAEEMALALERAARSGSLTVPEPPPLIERGTTGLLWIALSLSILLNVLLIALHVLL
ncbi:MAG TPA: bifunctional protein-serine/threonine kinase/phosphatase, partial [Polyangiales bacterium]|nr:bifunctional protein-serine/threonine kinase/phosphatase [Polyangiales bacterium]